LKLISKKYCGDAHRLKIRVQFQSSDNDIILNRIGKDLKMATQQTLTQKQTSKKAAPKVSAAKTTTAKTSVKPQAAKPVQAQQTASKGHQFRIAAGIVAKIEHKELNKAIKYHKAQGNIVATDKGYKLTEKGAANFGKRAADNPQEFQEIAAFVHGKGACPKVWAGQKTHVKVSESLTLPNMLYWGGFVTSNMRLAFAALWAK
jgi:hypothetical protein